MLWTNMLVLLCFAVMTVRCPFQFEILDLAFTNIIFLAVC